MKQIELETKLQQLETDLIDRKTSIENEIRATRAELAIAESEYYRKRGELKSRINAFEIQIANMKADYSRQITVLKEQYCNEIIENIKGVEGV